MTKCGLEMKSIFIGGMYFHTCVYPALAATDVGSDQDFLNSLSARSPKIGWSLGKVKQRARKTDCPEGKKGFLVEFENGDSMICELSMVRLSDFHIHDSKGY